MAAMSPVQRYYFPDLFRDFAFMPKFDDNIEQLATLAELEDWDYKNTPTQHRHPILRNYLTYTYRRIAEEKKIAITSDEEHACWNTGLITSTQEAIYVVFSKNKLPTPLQYWHYWRFCRQGEWELNRFSSLPDMAHYFDDPAVLVFDTRKELRVNVEHVVSDNLSRFPQSLHDMNPFGLQNLVRGAIESARQRVRRNYKTAIPQYYQGAIQLLLPLSLTDPAKADLALVWKDLVTSIEPQPVSYNMPPVSLRGLIAIGSLLRRPGRKSPGLGRPGLNGQKALAS